VAAAVLVLTFYAVMLGSAFAVRPSASTWLVFNAYCGHDGRYFYRATLDPWSGTMEQKHRFLRIAYPALASATAHAMDAILPESWVPSAVDLGRPGVVPRYQLFCAVSLVLLDLLFIALAAACLCAWLRDHVPHAALATVLLLVTNHLVSSSMPRCLSEPLVLLVVFRVQLVWKRNPWSLELFGWLIFAPFVKEYLLVLPAAWGAAQALSSGAAGPELDPRRWRWAWLRDPRRWGVAALAILLTAPYFAYWHWAAERLGETMLSLKGGHAQFNLGVPVLGYVEGIYELLTAPLAVSQASGWGRQLFETGYRAFHLWYYAMLLYLFFVQALRTLWQGAAPRWQWLIHLPLMGLLLVFGPAVTHSAGDLGRVMAASLPFWTGAALLLTRPGWRWSWIACGVGMLAAQWLRLLVLAGQGGIT
jgi:hypothetical protein